MTSQEKLLWKAVAFYVASALAMLGVAVWLYRGEWDRATFGLLLSHIAYQHGREAQGQAGEEQHGRE
jgi:hypothetical protein